MTVLIIGKTFESGRQHLDGMVKAIKPTDIAHIRKNSNEYSVKLANGDICRVASPNQSVRGIKCDKAYVQIGIDEDFIDDILRPMLYNSSLPKKEQIEYWYGEGEI